MSWSSALHLPSDGPNESQGLSVCCNLAGQVSVRMHYGYEHDPTVAVILGPTSPQTLRAAAMRIADWCEKIEGGAK